jgi:hypothetical protein
MRSPRKSPQPGARPRPAAKANTPAERPAGHVFVLPHQHVPASDVKDRGYVLRNRCAPPAPATLACRSTKGTERDQFGAPATNVESASAILAARHREALVETWGKAHPRTNALTH